MLKVCIEGVALFLEDAGVAFGANVIELQAQVRIGGHSVRPTAQHVAAPRVELIVVGARKAGRVGIKGAENLMDGSAISIPLERQQILIGHIPVQPKTPAAQLPGIVGILPIGQRGVIPVEVGSINPKKGMVAELIPVADARETALLSAAARGDEGALGLL